MDELTLEQKAALWLIAFSLRDRSEWQLDARTYPMLARIAARSMAT